MTAVVMLAAPIEAIYSIETDIIAVVMLAIQIELKLELASPSQPYRFL